MRKFCGTIIALISTCLNMGAQCVAYSGDLEIYPALNQEGGIPFLSEVTVALPKGFNGVLSPRKDRFGNPLFHAQLILYNSKATEVSGLPALNEVYSGDSICHVYELRATSISREACKFQILRSLPEGRYRLVIPEGLFEIDPDYVEVAELDLPEEDLTKLSVTGAWHKPGRKWEHPGMFSFHDDDGMDGTIPSSNAGNYAHGYFSTWYPMLESLGVRGCLSLEGRRAGFTTYPPSLNDNGKIAKRLQDESGWEIMSHSMKCLGERLNCWAVESIDSPEADKILKEAYYAGQSSPYTTAIYSRATKKQYIPDAELTKWIELDDTELIRPYIGNYETRKPILFDDNYNIKYHWGEWFVQAENNGIKGHTWVMHNAQSSHKAIPAIVAECPLGFVDQYPILYNTPPMTTVAGRMLCEGQFFNNVPAGDSKDNSYNRTQYEWLRKTIEEAHNEGGWIIMGGHAYRAVWDNYREGELLSEGGTYPDEWVNPMEGINPLTDPLSPPKRLGISDWSEWYPCPGTRLRMMWDLLCYAKSLGMINVTSREGFEILGNKVSSGYFTKGHKIGYDNDSFEGARTRQPHYVKGANDEEFYYNRGVNNEIIIDFEINIGSNPRKPIIAYAVDGTYKIVNDIAQLPRGIWFVNRRKLVVK